MASSVTMQFVKDSVSSSAGIAVISFDLPSTSRWPALLAGADQMQRPLGLAERAAQRLAVNRHDLPVEGFGKGLGPGAEAGLEGVRVDQPEDAPEGVVRGNAVGQGQEGQPSLLRP
jgi:hypothetical protein